MSKQAGATSETSDAAQATAPAKARPELSYEQAREELVEVVRKLEAGGTTLEESLALWERGEELAATCQQWLDGARKRLAEVQAAHTPATQQPAG
ncbi:exodeoxyribonuclease VII small subunit [Kribbella deserti]|uniref:Exodeoxyribonuclease 7 small subunit n=1 Tax=Kribbella deserti TaxID=1926257 RepID=A0ABV6QMQ1_9ACTN